MHPLRRGSLAVAIATTAFVVPARAAVVTIQPSSQDAFIQQDSPNRLNGSGAQNKRVRVQSATLPAIWRGLVQFDLSTIPQFSTVNSATLEINEGNNPGTLRTHGVHRINAAWLQSAVKWNNQPAHQATATATAPVGTSRGFKSFVVTGDVQAFVNAPASNRGWMIKDAAETSGNVLITYVALEEDSVHEIGDRPRLIVDFEAPECTTNADCADTNPCTTNERCQSGFCAVDATSCDDNDACTDDICDPEQGCLNPIGACNDGFDCTIDACDAQLGCTHTPVDSICEAEGCTVGTCVADPDRTDIDPVTGCFITAVNPDGTPCTPDSDECTDDECVSGQCTHPFSASGTSCTADGNPCTDDVCDGSGTCGVNNTAECSDGNGCTIGDQCNGGSCVPGSPVVCTPLGQCYDAGTCNPADGTCSNPPKAGGEPCNDSDACTETDQCDGAGVCVGNPVVCMPLGQCYDAGTCNPADGTCSNPPKASGEPCNDNDACTETDQCDGAGVCVGGDPVVCTPLDQCHDAGTCNSGTGLCSNPIKQDGTGCDDGNTCTLNDECSAGVCIGDSQTCGDGIVQAACGEECDTGGPSPDCTVNCRFVCGPAPQEGCRKPVLSGKSLVVLKDKALDKRDAMSWKWVKGVATTIDEFGDPLSTTDYTLCVYDQSSAPQPLIQVTIPAGGTCGLKPCWKSVRGGYKYKDRGASQGATLGLLRSGSSGRAKTIVRGKGENLGMTSLPLTPKVTVQLKRHDNPSLCWDAEYSTPLKNQSDQFKARAD